uniref:Uncharacterized protein n=1 Tax=Elaeophora elaphi TaxID=1147741 RepID=A0A0R3S248_9BILA
MPISSTNSDGNNDMVSGKMQQSEMSPKNRSKRFWTEVRPLKRDYPDFEDDQKGEEYYRKQFKEIILPNIHNFSVNFTFTTRLVATTMTTTTRKITTLTTINATKAITIRPTARKLQSIASKKTQLKRGLNARDCKSVNSL